MDSVSGRSNNLCFATQNFFACALADAEPGGDRAGFDEADHRSPLPVWPASTPGRDCTDLVYCSYYPPADLWQLHMDEASPQWRMVDTGSLSHLIDLTWTRPNSSIDPATESRFTERADKLLKISEAGYVHHADGARLALVLPIIMASAASAESTM